MTSVRTHRSVAALVAVLVLGGAGLAQAQGAKPPGFTAAQAAHGAELYSTNCAMCHGDHLDDGDFAPPLKGQAYATYWAGKSAADVLTYINTMMPPTDPGGLGAKGGADVFAHMLKSGGAQPGDKALPTDPAALTAAGIK